jgi:hypothetical protein
MKTMTVLVLCAAAVWPVMAQAGDKAADLSIAEYTSAIEANPTDAEAYFNRVFVERDGALFNKAFTALLAYPAGKAASSYAVPEGVTRIGESAFAECKSLASISLPESLTAIGDEAFIGCGSLAAISLSASRPPALHGRLGTSAVIYVPAAAVDAYKEAPEWKEHADQIRAIEQ